MQQALYPEFCDFITHMISVLMPNGFDTTSNGADVNSFTKLKRRWDETNRVLVWDGASDNTIHGLPRYNHAFRAWHDYVHLTNCLGFGYAGEIAVMRIQQEQCKYHYTGENLELMLKIIEYEIKGQLDYYKEHNDFVPNQVEYCKQWMQEAV